MQNLVRSKIKSVQKKANQSFAERFYSINFLIEVILLPLLIVWSATTEFFFLNITFGNTFNAAGAIILTVLAIVILESGKYAFGKKGLHLFLSGKFTTASHYLPWAGILLILNVVFFGGSYYMSINGSQTTADVFAREKTPIATKLINIDSINTAYDEKIASLAPTQKAALSSTWKGKLTQTGARLAKSIQVQKNAIEVQRTTALSQATAANTAITSKYETDISSRKTWFQMFAGWGELIMLLLLGLTVLYDLGVEADEKGNKKETEDATTSGFFFGRRSTVSTAETRDENEPNSETNPLPSSETETAASFETTHFADVSEPETVSENTPPETETKVVVSDSETRAQIAILKRKIKSYEWKIRNKKGRPETARKRIAEFQNQIQQLQQNLE